FEREPNPAGELHAALLIALETAGVGPGPTGVEELSLPHTVAEWLREAGRAPVAVASLRQEPDLHAIRRASRLADVVQQSVKDHAAPGVSEAELAGLAAARMFKEAGRRLPAILTVSTGATVLALEPAIYQPGW